MSELKDKCEKQKVSQVIVERLHKIDESLSGHSERLKGITNRMLGTESVSKEVEAKSPPCVSWADEVDGMLRDISESLSYIRDNLTRLEEFI